MNLASGKRVARRFSEARSYRQYTSKSRDAPSDSLSELSKTSSGVMFSVRRATILAHVECGW